VLGVGANDQQPGWARPGSDWLTSKKRQYLRTLQLKTLTQQVQPKDDEEKQ
jgi:hypothetical protein